MAADNANPKGIWSWIGKLAVLLGVILAASQVYERFSNRGIHLSAVGYNSQFNLPHTIVEAVIEAQKPIEKERVVSLLPPLMIERDNVADQIISAVTNPIAKRVNAEKDQDILKKFVTINDYTQIEVTNDGDREVTDVKFECDGCSGLYQLQGLGGDPSFGNFKQSIPLGSLRPSNSIRISVWIDYGFLSRSRPYDTRITHPNGVVAIQYPQHVWGWSAWIADNMFFLALAIVILFIVLLIFAVRGALRYGATHPQDALATLKGVALPEAPNADLQSANDTSEVEHTVLLQVVQNPGGLVVSAGTPAEEKTAPPNKK